MSIAVHLSPVALVLVAFAAAASSSPEPDPTAFAAPAGCSGCGVGSLITPETQSPGLTLTWTTPSLPSRPPVGDGQGLTPWSFSAEDMGPAELGSYSVQGLDGECELDGASCVESHGKGCGADIGMTVMATNYPRPPFVDDTLDLRLPDGTAVEFERDGQWHWLLFTSVGACGESHEAVFTFENGDSVAQGIGCSPCSN